MTEQPVHTTADDVHAHAHKTGHGKLDLVLALSAIFISAISLIVAIEHGRTERELVAASSWPFVQEILSDVYGSRKDVAFGVTNVGVGPAKIKSVEVFYRGRPVSNPIQLLQRCCGLDMSKPFRKQLPENLYTSLVDESVLRPGQDNIVLALHQEPSAPEIPRKFAASLLDLSFRACFCSVLDECWTADLRTTRATPVRECQMPEHPYSPNGH